MTPDELQPAKQHPHPRWFSLLDVEPRLSLPLSPDATPCSILSDLTTAERISARRFTERLLEILRGQESLNDPLFVLTLWQYAHDRAIRESWGIL